jgi:hypothetical protein
VRYLLVFFAAVVVAACGAQKTIGPPSDAGGSGPAPTTNFTQAGAMSGCPSPECTAILNQVADGAKTDNIPGDLTPSLQASMKDLSFPPGQQCDTLPTPNLRDDWQPCTYPTGAKPDAPLMVVIGDSQAWMWSSPLVDIASQLGYRAAAVQHQGCGMADVVFPTASGGYTDQDCKAWKSAAIDWVNHQNPAAVLVASAYSEAISPDKYSDGYARTLKTLSAPGRKVFVMGDVPRLAQDPPHCLAGHESSATKCATQTAKAAPAVEQESALDAATQAHAAYVNLTPLACTPDSCPAIIGHYAAYQDQYHFTTSYAKALAPVVARALNLAPASP